jgi:LuxR family maltose regulon positive regulatory protein
LSATAEHQSRVRRERRIIERPRLIKLLDEAEQRTILLLAPAGYGKTTLARQWGKTLNRAIWITLTPAHRDVVTLAEDIADGIDALGGDAKAFIGEYLRGQANPQRAARDVGRALARQADKSRVQWVVLDDYHELADGSASEELVLEMLDRSRTRLLLASRSKPSWTSSRGVVYGEELEISLADLAMTEAESRAMVGKSANELLVSQSHGWPAALALAGAFAEGPLPGKSMLPATLHSYLAEELFSSADEELKSQLVALALLPNLSARSLRNSFGGTADDLVDKARDLGFLGLGDSVDLHPLLREFLLTKVEEMEGSRALAESAVAACVDAGEWDRAASLAERFDLSDALRHVLEAAYKGLVRSGRVETLSRLGGAVRSMSSQGEPEVDLVDAEVALRNGEYRLAAQIVSRLGTKLRRGHVLRSRSYAIAGTAAFQFAQFSDSERAFEEAHTAATDDTDVADALHGLVLAAVYGEGVTGDQRLAELARRAELSGSPIDVARHAACALARMRIGPGFVDSPYIEDALRVLPHVEDPRARTSVMVTLSYCLGLQSEYTQAAEIAAHMLEEVNAFGLEFARPHADWNIAFAALGMRRFADADRALQRVEDSLAKRHLGHHVLNAKVLRARLLMQQARHKEAFELVRDPINDAAAPSMHGEYVAVRAVALALMGELSSAVETANLATSTSISSEVRVLSEGARAIVAAERGEGKRTLALLHLARETRIWDPLVCCVRASPALAAALTSEPSARPELETLYNKTNDYGLARRAHLRTRNVRNPSEVLSPREQEVLELMAQGFRNRDIAAAFVISESTVKIHVRHVLEKLGVRTRTQAVARYKSEQG